jgi:hypothetical protein
MAERHVHGGEARERACTGLSGALMRFHLAYKVSRLRVHACILLLIRHAGDGLDLPLWSIVPNKLSLSPLPPTLALATFLCSILIR